MVGNAYGAPTLDVRQKYHLIPFVREFYVRVVAISVRPFAPELLPRIEPIPAHDSIRRSPSWTTGESKLDPRLEVATE